MTSLHQSIEYVQFFVSIGAAAVLSWVVWELEATPTTYTADNASLPLVQTSNQWFDTLIQNLPLVFLFIAGMGALAMTVFKSQFR